MAHTSHRSITLYHVNEHGDRIPTGIVVYRWSAARDAIARAAHRGEYVEAYYTR